MTPEELDDTRRHAARMSDQELGDLYIKGPGTWPPEAWQIVEEEVSRRERSKRVAGLRGGSPRGAAHGRPAGSPNSGSEKSNAVAGCLGLLLGPVGLWYKGQWAAGFAWLVMAVILGIASGGLLAPFLLSDVYAVTRGTLLRGQR